jgi:NAD(P)-dependent dehydrogenase (short-subunit alcohol dehydrogenase family)
MQPENKTPSAPAAPEPEPLPDGDIATCVRVLQAIIDSPDLMMTLTFEQRRDIRRSAGLLIRRDEEVSKSLQRIQRKQNTKDRKKQRREDALLRATVLQNQERAAQKRAAQGHQPITMLPPPPAEGPELGVERSCYICKGMYRRLHPFYGSLCTRCGDFNYAKRTPTANLNGKVALITGGRLKIGFHASMMLLRSGCRVIVTTRFPHDAAARYAREPDFASFSDRLQIYGLDLRHSPSVELFARYLDSTLDRLDFLINNAAQTVRRPPGFYAHLLAGEETAFASLPPHEQHILAGHESVSNSLRQAPAIAASSQAQGKAVLGAWTGDASGVGLWGSAQLSQLPYDQEPVHAPAGMFPVGQMDMDLQQVDMRKVNSWRLKLADVPTPEMLEVHLVNTVAPFVLNARLKGLMMRSQGRHKHIVNVSAVEGQFNRGTKTDKHPHTNMAKAALNMMTRTSAQDYEKDGIHMNSVDTGWVTDEDPAHIAERKTVELDFQPPLDTVDGAARIVDPIFVGINTGVHVYGKFLKDYRPVEW